MTKTIDYEKLRHQFRPDDIRILFVGESRPASGKFFYCDNSQLADNMKMVLGKYLFGSTDNFLQVFMESGCFLDDLVLTPINNLKVRDPKRSSTRRKCIPHLSQRIEEYQPRVVVALLKMIKNDVREAFEMSNVNATFICTHFPGYDQQKNFENDIVDNLPVLKAALL